MIGIEAVAAEPGRGVGSGHVDARAGQGGPRQRGWAGDPAEERGGQRVTLRRPRRAFRDGVLGLRWLR
jgi:hypothetical protein